MLIRIFEDCLCVLVSIPVSVKYPLVGFSDSQDRRCTEAILGHHCYVGNDQFTTIFVVLCVVTCRGNMRLNIPLTCKSVQCGRFFWDI